MQNMENAETRITAAYSARVKKAIDPSAIVAIFAALMNLVKNCQQPDPAQFLKDRPVIARAFIRNAVRVQGSRHVSVDDAVESIVDVATAAKPEEVSGFKDEVIANDTFV